MSGRKISDLLDGGYEYTEIILQYLLDWTRSKVLSSRDLELEEQMLSRFLKIQKDLKEGRPLQYAIGVWNFFGYDFKVDERALIPRPETELLVEEVLKEDLKDKKILDIGTGTGAISIALKLEGPESVKVVAADISSKTLSLAKENAQKLGADIEFIESDVFSNISEKFDYIVSNPPYLTDQEYDQVDDLLLKEPKNALVAGPKGYEIYEEIINKAGEHLRPGGKLFFEIGYAQGQVVSDLLYKNGYNNIKVIKDYSGLDRIVIGELCLIN